MHCNARQFPAIHCQCTRFLFLLAKEVQDQRRSWECQTKFWCIVPSFKTAAVRDSEKYQNFRGNTVALVSLVSCLCPTRALADDKGWHNEQRKKVWLMFHKRTIKASQDNGQRYKWGGQGPCQGPNISLTHVHCCANLYKTVSRTLSIIWSISCYLAMLPKLEFESPPWQEHVCECVEVSIWVQAIPNDWVGDTLEHTWPSPDHHIWAANGGLFPFSNYLARLPTIDRAVLLRW